MAHYSGKQQTTARSTALIRRLLCRLLLAAGMASLVAPAVIAEKTPTATSKVQELHFYFPDKRIGWLYEVKKDTIWLRTADAKQLAEARGHVVLKHDPETLALSLNNNALKDTSWISKIKPNSLSLLTLTQTKVKAPWFENLKPLGWLPNLHLVRCPIDDEGLMHLKALPNLQILVLDDNELDGSGFRFLPETCPSLRVLSADRCKIDGKNLVHLEKLKNLQRLSIDEARLNDEQVQPLTRMKSLEFLGLSSTQIGDKAIHALIKLPKLVQLRIAYTRITTAVFKEIAKSSLVWLDLEGCELRGLQPPAFPKTLRMLFLSMARGVDDDFMARFHSSFPKFSQLMLARTKVTGRGLKYLSNQTGISFFIASSLGLKDEDLGPIAKMKAMQRLLLKGNNITGKGLAFLPELPNLLDLDLSQTQVGDEVIPALKKCKKLQYVSLPNTKISKQGIEELRRSHPECTFEHNEF